MQHPSHGGSPRWLRKLALGRLPSSLAAAALVAATAVAARLGRSASPPTAASPGADVVRAEGWIVDNHCAPFLDVGARCVLTVDPVPPRGPLNCRMTLSCDGHALYGALGEGYLRCRRDPDGSLVAEDAMTAERDGDPAALWRRSTGRAELDFGRADAPARCAVVAR